MFYGGAAAVATERKEGGDPMDIDGGGFESGDYLQKIYTALPLAELVTKEKKIGSQIKSLDSEMQASTPASSSASSSAFSCALG
jgi:hypothetical protein